MTCIFCDIVAGRVPAVLVHEDDDTVAFMDRRQGNPGHVLVVPRAHHAEIYDLPDDVGAAVMVSVLRVARAVRAAFDCPGLNLWQSNGACAGQEVGHVHVHVHPRRPDDGLLKAYARPPATPSEQTLREYGVRIRAALGSGAP